jgi:hypothetical protein
VPAEQKLLDGAEVTAIPLAAPQTPLIAGVTTVHDCVVVG